MVRSRVGLTEYIDELRDADAMDPDDPPVDKVDEQVGVPADGVSAFPVH